MSRLLYWLWSAFSLSLPQFTIPQSLDQITPGNQVRKLQIWAENGENVKYTLVTTASEVARNSYKLGKLLRPGRNNACWWLTCDRMTQWSHYSIWSIYSKCQVLSIMSRAMLSVCRHESVWWVGVIWPHTGVCMLTSSLMHHLIGLLRQPDIFKHIVKCAHTHTNTHI